MEKQVRTFLDKHRQQPKQVLIIASGYDTLSWRLATEYPDTNFIELDHPATGGAKYSRSGQSMAGNSAFDGSVFPPNLLYCHASVGETTSLGDALRKCYRFDSPYGENSAECSFQPHIATAVVMEGLTFYLSEDQNRDIFSQLAELVGCKGTIVAFDFFQLNEFHRPVNPNTQKVSTLFTSFMKYKVKTFGESFQWGIDPMDLPGFFECTPWRLIPSWPNGKTELTVMMGIEYEATVEWQG